MHPRMAFSAQCDQALFFFTTQLAAKLEVVHLHALHALHATATPGIATHCAPAPSHSVHRSSSNQVSVVALCRRRFSSGFSGDPREKGPLLLTGPELVRGYRDTSGDAPAEEDPMCLTYQLASMTWISPASSEKPNSLHRKHNKPWKWY